MSFGYFVGQFLSVKDDKRLVWVWTFFYLFPCFASDLFLTYNFQFSYYKVYLLCLISSNLCQSWDSRCIVIISHKVFRPKMSQCVLEKVFSQT